MPPLDGTTGKHRKHCTICAWMNQKGGVGKTGNAVGVAGGLAERGRRVLLADLDPQGNMTTTALQMGEEPAERAGRPNLYDALVGNYTGPVEDLILSHSTHTSGGKIDVIPHTMSMFLATRQLYAGRAGERALRRLLERVDKEAYDHILIDCPPQLDIITDNCIAATDSIVIPVQPEETSRRALELLLNQLRVIEDELELRPRKLYGLVMSNFRRPLSSLDRHMARQLESYDTGPRPLPVLAHVPYAVAVKEAWLRGKTLTDYDPNAQIAEGYRRLAVHLDVQAGFADQAELDALGTLEKLGAEKEKPSAMAEVA